MPEARPSNITTQEPATPVGLSRRIESIDVLRGFAVLGILVMNIQSYSMVDPAYFNPTVFGDWTGINFAVWLVSHLFFDTKFMTLFTLLFGAGIVLMARRIEERGYSPASLHYRRILWLLLFGLIHAYMLWHGDILVWYSLSALLAYFFWRVRPGWLLFWSLLLLLIGTGIYALIQWSMPFWPPEAITGNAQYWTPSAEVIAQRLEAFRGGWLDQMSERVQGSLMLHTFVYLSFGVWRTIGVMLAGMALMKWGIISAEKSNRFYTVTLLIGFVVGLPLIGYGASQHIAHDWSLKYSLYGGMLPNYWGSLLVAAAYLSFWMLSCKNQWLSCIRRSLARVGRMAFSNYILQTLICTTLFYGHGFGLFGQIPRWGQLAITVTIWVVLIMASDLWMTRFRFGPLEWLWRTLTYGKRQPMR
ncbi:MAG: DUF418 domain-containing protein [candidate division Zixibacteria bacterium]|nr:DUF418 domain-containing protein [candidate division Zixibacteria bacterium]